MAYVVDLSDAWKKLDRAKAHIDDLRGQIGEVGEADGIPIPLWHQYEEEKRAVVWRIERIPELPAHWPLIVGDAVHNFRSTLNYLAWQLAIKERGGAPTNEEAPQIQFPIEVDPARWTKTKGNQYLRFMLQEDVDRLEPFQPFKIPAPKTHGLYGLNAASNEDKHRFIPLLTCASGSASWTNVPKFIQCEPLLVNGNPPWHFTVPSFPMSPNDEVLRVDVLRRGAYPDVELEPHLTGYVAFSDGRNVLTEFDGVGKGIVAILKAFGPIP